MLPLSATRVQEATSPGVNQAIWEEMESRILWYADHPEFISERLAELDREWDIERALEATAASLAFTGTVLGAAAGRRWLLVPAVVTGFLLQHALQGWCPPLPVFRRLGFRAPNEIEAERYALKAIRGDFSDLAPRAGVGIVEERIDVAP